MNEELKQYFATIGRRGGKKSRRTLTPQQARDMVRVREARRAYRRYSAECFWSYDPELRITLADIPWVVETLMKNGGPEALRIGKKLCQ
jgi:hypothetical protein